MPTPIVHFEIGCANTEATQKFYSHLFGWEFHGMNGAAMVTNIGPSWDGSPAKTPGIAGHINSLGHPPHQYVTVYAEVSDIKATLEQVVKLGGKVCVPMTEVPNMGHFAWFFDPEGNCLGLWKSAACAG